MFKDYWKTHPFPILKKEDGTEWITVNGAHIPIKDGQSKDEAVAQHFEGMDEKEFVDVANLAAKVPKIHPDDVAIMSRFIGAVESKDEDALSGKLGDDAEKLAEFWNIPQDKGTAGIAKEFKRIFEGKKKVKPTLLEDDEKPKKA